MWLICKQNKNSRKIPLFYKMYQKKEMKVEKNTYICTLNQSNYLKTKINYEQIS